MFSKKFLFNLYNEDIRYRTVVGIDKINKKSFEQHLNKSIDIICSKVHNGTYKFSKYKEKLISKGKNRFPRVISIPTMRDKLVLKALFLLLKTVFPENCSLPHKIINEVLDAYKSGLYKSYLRLDIKDFYPTINHKILLPQISKKIRKQEILSLIANSISQITIDKPAKKQNIRNCIGVPQGLPISSILADLYMVELDKKFKNKKSYIYFRFIDDILILSKSASTDRIKNKFVQECDQLGLNIHDENEKPCKMSYGKIESGFEYLGYKFSGPIVSVRNSSVEKIEESIIKQFVHYKYSNTKNINLLVWSLNLRITGCIFDRTNYGWLFYFSQIEDPTLLHRLDHFVDKMKRRFMEHPSNIKIKKFAKAIYEIEYNLRKTHYIPNFDKITIDEKKQILNDIFLVGSETLTPDEVTYQFNRKIYRTIKDLEKDLARAS